MLVKSRMTDGEFSCLASAIKSGTEANKSRSITFGCPHCVLKISMFSDVIRSPSSLKGDSGHFILRNRFPSIKPSRQSALAVSQERVSELMLPRKRTFRASEHATYNSSLPTHLNQPQH